MAPPAAAGRAHKGPFDLRQVGARNSRHPSGRILPRAGFCAGPLEPHSGITLNNLEIYETNTSNQSQSARFPEFSVNGLLLSSDRRRQVDFLCRSPGKESARLLQIKQRILRRRNEPGLHRRAFVLYFDRWPRRLASHVDAYRSDSHDQELLTAAD